MTSSIPSLTLGQRLSEYEKLMRLDKPIGILLLLWPTLWALWVASDGRPTAWIVAIFVIGTVLMRSAGCVINDYVDKDFDGHVERTRNRPLAARRISPKEALWLAAGLAVLSFVLILPLNGLSIGVQSFDDAKLAALGRVHDRAQAIAAAEEAAQSFDTFTRNWHRPIK